MSNKDREDYEWRRGKSLQDFGCLAAIGLGVIVCTGFVKYGFRDGFNIFYTMFLSLVLSHNTDLMYRNLYYNVLCLLGLKSN